MTDDAIQIGVLNDATNTIVPGLGQIYVDIAPAFADWCNAAGGINGRQIEFVSRDAELTNGAAAVIEACQSDFMLVGGATPLDAPTVDPRLECDLGAIPAYTASPEATDSDLQVFSPARRSDQANVAAFHMLADDYGDAYARTGILAVDQASLLPPVERLRAAAPEVDVNVDSFQLLPLDTSANFRTFVQPLVGNIDTLVPPLSPTAGLFRAMADVGFEPQLIVDPIGNTYGQPLLDAIADTPPTAPYYLATNVFPLELAGDNPATQLAIDLTEASGTEAPVDAGIALTWGSWLLFAKAASSCTDELSSECVLAAAETLVEDGFDGGGLYAADSACRALLSVSPDGYEYEEELTNPTEGVFNCDPENLISVPEP